MLATILFLGIVVLVGGILFGFLFGIAGVLIALLIKILVLGLVAYLVLRIVSPKTAARVREHVEKQSFPGW